MKGFEDAFFRNRLELCKKELIPAKKEFSIALRKLKYWKDEYDLCERRLAGVTQIEMFEGGESDAEAKSYEV